jgi:hypothetical protein
MKHSPSRSQAQERQARHFPLSIPLGVSKGFIWRGAWNKKIRPPKWFAKTEKKDGSGSGGWSRMSPEILCGAVEYQRIVARASDQEIALAA